MSSTPDLLTQIVHESERAYGKASYAANGFRALTGLQAFRGYEWMTDTRTLNVSGNFRGMVISARWATAYEVVSSAAKALGTAATVASLAATVVDMAPKFEQVYRSNAGQLSKAQQYSLLTSIVAQKVLAGIVTGGVHLIYSGLILGCNEVAKAGRGGTITMDAKACSQVIQNADTLVQQTSNYLTDPATQQKVILNLLTIKIAN